MTGFAPTRAGHGVPVAEWGYSPAGLHLNGAQPPGRVARGRVVEGTRYRFGASGTISGDTLAVPTPNKFLFDLGPLADRCIMRFTVAIANSGTGHAWVLGSHHIPGATGTNYVYQYHGGDNGGNQGIRMDEAGSDGVQIGLAGSGAGTFTYEFRWCWPECELLRNGTPLMARTMFTGSLARLSRGPLFGPRGSGGSPIYSDVEVWAAPRLWSFSRFVR